MDIEGDVQAKGRKNIFNKIILEIFSTTGKGMVI
jgi:hypothetical protein